jgi:hypothetical protein
MAQGAIPSAGAESRTRPTWTREARTLGDHGSFGALAGRPRLVETGRDVAKGTAMKRRADMPSVEELLDVDREYRERAAAGTLHRIAPRRMNPRHEAWLPILHTTRGPRHYTALFSNTPNAHQQGQTHDWVVLYFDRGGSGGEHQCTVITARFGALAGHRIVRGREDECLELMRRREWEAMTASHAKGALGSGDLEARPRPVMPTDAATPFAAHGAAG